ncbi:hypothetical protein KIV63_gp49 [Mycobacterium phage SWU2]|uniref:Uncharacterized protein n=1 Tax=Mycobacterium phage SWU2 TaxID=2077150 RepID=A0A2K9VIC7_9CAUD|nr:hypothetical protein KIV63_gp49 [Mycobacterium phage SWU2]AUV61995.1 hypothetical protein JX_gp36 [Mycobacterium phage SWU2]
MKSVTGKKLYANGYGGWSINPWSKDDRGPLWRRARQQVLGTLRQPFIGPVGPQGPMGDRGEPGHLQLSGFPDGTLICLYNDQGRLLWSGKLRKAFQ